MTTERPNANIAQLSDRALYRRSEEMLFEAARLHCSGRRSGLRKRVRRYLKPYRRDRTFLASLVSSVGRALVVAYLLAQLWATEVSAQPSFSSSSPANAKHNITVGSNITATFSQAIASGTVSSSTFVVHGGFIGKHSTGGTASTHKDATYTGGGTTTLTINPGANLAPGELLSVTLTTGLQNGSAQALSSAKVFQFRAATTGGPAVFSNNSHNVDASTNATRSISLGDLDGDGDLDLVTGDYSQVNRVYLGNSNGTFAAGSNVATPTNQTWSVSLGDLDGDGDLDFLAGNRFQANRVYLGNGNGTFASGNNADTPANSTLSVSLGDLDGDGDLDLVTGNGNSQVNRVYLGNGNGTFASGNNVDTPANVTQFVSLGDLDGDGDLDLVTGNFNQVNRVYLGDGDGTFASGSDIDAATNSTQSVTLGDFDEDGDLDLVTGDNGQVTRLHLGNGNGSFAAGSAIATPTNGTLIALVGDVDGNGDLDLVTGNWNQVNRVYLGNGNGTFSSGSDVDTPTNQTFKALLGDLDGDGDLDLVAANYTQVNRIYLNNNTKFSSSSPAANANSAATTTNISPTFTQSMQAATNSTFVVHGSMTGKRTGTYSGSNSTTLSFDSTKDFLPGEVVDVTLTAGLQNTSGDAMQPPRAYRLRTAAVQGPAVFSNISNDVATPTNQTYSVSLGDLDGDGDIDIVAGNAGPVNRVYLGNGNGTFASGSDVDTPTNTTRAVPLGDVDGDGDLDLVAGNQNQANRVYLGTGNGTFATGNDVDTPTNQTYSLSLGDIDGDGDLDLLVGNQNQVNRVYLGNGNGTFATGNDVDAATNNTIFVSLGDVDGDGDLDLVTGDYNQVNRVYQGDGNGTFGSPSNVDTPTNNTNSISLGDLDSDGDLDLATGNFNQVNRIYLGNGNGTFASGNDVDTPTNATISLSLGDVDGDGDLDLLAGNYNQVNRFYLGIGNGAFASGSDVDTPANNTDAVSLGDLDGDNDLDLVTGNRSEVNRVYLNSGNKDGTLTASATLDESSTINLTSTVDTAAEAVDLFDFTFTDGSGGDGLALIVSKIVLNTSGTGAFSQVVWLLNGPDASNVGGTYSSSANTITFSGLSISVADGANETYKIRGYYSDTTGLVDGATFSLSLDGDTEVTATAGSSMSGGNSAVSNAAAAKVVAPPLPTSNRVVHLPENSSVMLASNLLTFADASSTTGQIVYTVQAVPTAGKLIKSGSTLGAGGTFTQDDIDNNRISYAHGGSEFSNDHFLFTVIGTPGLTTANTAFQIEVDPVNDAPALDVLREVHVDEGGTVVISNGYLRVLDSDAKASAVTFTVHEGPFHGRLGRSTFSQADIDRSLVSYVHDGSETQRDSLLFSVSDGNGAGLVTTWLSFAVRSLNDGPIIPSIENPNIKEGELLVLDLTATDPEGAALTTTVTGLPTGATLDGTMLKWLPLYDQAGSYPLAAVYDDGQGGTSRLRIDINVADSPVPMLLPEPSLVDFGDVPAGETADRSFALVNQAPVALDLAPFSSTSSNLNISSPVFPQTLEPGERVDIAVRFTATADRADLQQALLTSATKLGPAEVPVVGRSVWRRLVADNDEIAFLPAVIGDTRWKHLNLSNPGNLALEVSAQLPDPTPFGVEPSELTLPGGQDKIMRVRFVPITIEPAEELLTLTSELGQVDIPLRGQGREPEKGQVSIDFNPDQGNQQQNLIGGAISGSVYVLQLHASGVPQVSGWSVRIDYDPDELSYVEGSFAPGSFLRRITPLERVGEGYVEAGGEALGGESLARGNGVLGTLSFQVDDGFSGQTELSVSRVTWHREDRIGLDRNFVYASANITAAAVTFISPADFNADGSVDTDDFLLFADQFGRRVPPAEPRFDLDGDGRVSHLDFFLFADLVFQE